MSQVSGHLAAHPPAGFANTALLKPRGALYLASLGQQVLLDQLKQELAPSCPRLELLDAGGTVISTATTDANGDYRFAGLPPGVYSVRQPTQPPGTSNGIITHPNHPDNPVILYAVYENDYRKSNSL